MFYKYELQEMIDSGRASGNVVKVVRKNSKIFDIVLEGEPVKSSEVITVERILDVLDELPE